VPDILDRLNRRLGRCAGAQIPEIHNPVERIAGCESFDKRCGTNKGAATQERPKREEMAKMIMGGFFPSQTAFVLAQVCLRRKIAE